MFRFSALRGAGARMMTTATGNAFRASPRAGILAGATAAAGVASGLYGFQAENLKIEIDEATAKKLLAALSAGGKPAAAPRYNELMASPAGAKIKACVVE